MSLEEDLIAAEYRNTKAVDRPCRTCQVIAGLETPEAREVLRRAAAGTIGRDTLVAILARNGTPVGRRDIERHRQQGHMKEGAQ